MSVKMFWKMIRVIRIPWLLVGIAVALSLLNAKMSIAFPDYQRRYFEKGNLTAQTIGVGIVILLASGALNMMASSSSSYLRSEIVRRFRDRVFQKSLNLSVTSLEKLNPNELISRTTADTLQLGDFFVTVTVTLLSSIYAVYINLKLIGTYHRQLMLFHLAVIPVLVLLRGIEGHVEYKIQYRIQHRLARLTEYLAEILANVPLIKAFVQEEKELAHGVKVIDDYNDSQFKMNLVMISFIVADYIIQLGVRLFGILYGGYLVKIGEISLATWMAYFGLSMILYMKLGAIVQQWAVFKGVQSAMARVAEIFTFKDERLSGELIAEPDAPLTVNHLSVEMAGKELLQDIAVTIAPKGKQAIVGTSGAGKTTLLNVLLGFYPATKGQVKIGQQLVDQVDLRAYRKQFAYVPQVPEIFTASLRDNLTYGVDHSLTDQALEEVCQQVHLERFVAQQADGLSTVLTDKGQKLSGGEREKIALARAILQLNDPGRRILLVDEGTANLDPSSEEEIKTILDELAQTYAVVLVSHRIDLVKTADAITVLDKGRVIGSGRHDQLLEHCTLYRQLAQAEGLEG